LAIDLDRSSSVVNCSPLISFSLRSLGSLGRGLPPLNFFFSVVLTDSFSKPLMLEIYKMIILRFVLTGSNLIIESTVMFEDIVQ